VPHQLLLLLLHPQLQSQVCRLSPALQMEGWVQYQASCQQQLLLLPSQAVD
jgi:hypothetical protein